VLPALGGVREYAVHDQNALVLADGSPDTIADAVIALALDPERLLSMRRAGIRDAQAFTVERAARSQLELFSTAGRRAELSLSVPA
jgi:glycosyltransferase involved in cell wall biosynthesis